MEILRVALNIIRCANMIIKVINQAYRKGCHKLPIFRGGRIYYYIGAGRLRRQTAFFNDIDTFHILTLTICSPDTLAMVSAMALLSSDPYA